MTSAEKSSHTPTWRVEGSVYEHMAAEIVGERGIAQVWAGPHAMEYAHLIAAAPDLLAALTDMLAGWRYIRQHHGDLYGVGWDRAEQAADAALAKASRP